MNKIKTDQRKRGLGFRSESIAEQMTSTGLDQIVELVDELDFELIYYEGHPAVLKRILNLRSCLLSEGLENQHGNIQEDLKKFVVDNESKVIIIVLKLLELLESQNYRIGLFEDGNYRIYTPKTEYWVRLNKSLISHFLCDVAERSGLNRAISLKKHIRESLTDHFNEHAFTPMPTKSVDKVLVCLENGTYEISNDFVGLREHRASDMLFNKLPFRYIEGATCPKFIDFLEKCLPEEEARMALAEISAYPLYPQLNLEKSAVLQGPGRTGKSTFQNIIISLYGQDNVCSYALASLCSPGATSDYNRARLPDYLLNYSSEMGAKGCDTNLVKKMISREQVEARHPYGKSFMVKDYCPMMFNVNELPPMENTSAFWWRFEMFPFHKVIKDSEINPDFASEIIANELPGVFNWLLDGLRRLMMNRKLTYSKLCADAKDRLRKENDSVASFLEEVGYVATGDDYVLSTVLFNEFTAFCKDNNYKSKFMSRTTFLRRIEENKIFVDRNAPNHQYRVYCTKVNKHIHHQFDNDITKMFGLPDCNE